MKWIKIVVILIIVILIGASLFRNKSNPKPDTINILPSQQTEAILKGFQLSPNGYFGSGFTNFFEINKILGGNAVAWTGSISDLSKKDGAANVVINLAKNYSYTPIIIIQSFDRKTNTLFPTFVDGETMIVNFAKDKQPKYFGIGVEVNMLYENNKTAYTEYVKHFNNFAQKIHGVSPLTKVFPIFQLEYMKGLRGGLFGGKNDVKLSNWSLLDQFISADAIAFTTYPTLIYKTPSEIPNSYYRELVGKTKKEILFAEIGWLRTKDISAWEGSEMEQEEFLRIFANQTSKSQFKVKLWSFLYDQMAAPVPFKGMGMRSVDNNSQEKLSPAEIFWQKM